MTSLFISLALKLGELIVDKMLTNREAKRKAAAWLERLQSRHDQTTAKLSKEYDRLIKKYRDSKL